MKLENQVCSFEQAKRLLQLGLKAESYFVWQSIITGTTELILTNKIVVRNEYKTKGTCIRHFPAYTVAELGDLLKKTEFEKHQRFNWYVCLQPTGEYYAGIDIEIWDYQAWGDYFLTEAQAKAEVLSWLINNNYLKIKDLKL